MASRTNSTAEAPERGDVGHTLHPLSSRRALLGSTIAAALAAAPPTTAAPTVDLGDNDRRLGVLHEAAMQARRDEDAAYKRGGNFEFSKEPAERAAFEQYKAIAEAADDRWGAALRAMADTPADGAFGLSAKLVHLLRGLGIGVALVEEDLAESLAADIARLFPGLSAELTP